MDLESNNKSNDKSNANSSTRASVLTEFSADYVSVNAGGPYGRAVRAVLLCKSCENPCSSRGPEVSRDCLDKKDSDATHRQPIQDTASDSSYQTSNKTSNNVFVYEIPGIKLSRAKVIKKLNKYNSNDKISSLSKQYISYKNDAKKVTLFTENDNISIERKDSHHTHNVEGRVIPGSRGVYPSNIADKKYVEKTTYCRPMLTVNARDFISKATERTTKLKCLVKKIVEAREKEKQSEAWNNYINELKNKHCFYNNDAVNERNEFITEERSSESDDHNKTEFKIPSLDASSHLLREFYQVPLAKGLYRENILDPLVYPTASQKYVNKNNWGRPCRCPIDYIPPECHRGRISGNKFIIKKDHPRTKVKQFSDDKKKIRNRAVQTEMSNINDKDVEIDFTKRVTITSKPDVYQSKTDHSDSISNHNLVNKETQDGGLTNRKDVATQDKNEQNETTKTNNDKESENVAKLNEKNKNAINEPTENNIENIEKKIDKLLKTVNTIVINMQVEDEIKEIPFKRTCDMSKCIFKSPDKNSPEQNIMIINKNTLKSLGEASKENVENNGPNLTKNTSTDDTAIDNENNQKKGLVDTGVGVDSAVINRIENRDNANKFDTKCEDDKVDNQQNNNETSVPATPETLNSVTTTDDADKDVNKDNTDSLVEMRNIIEYKSDPSDNESIKIDQILLNTNKKEDNDQHEKKQSESSCACVVLLDSSVNTYPHSDIYRQVDRSVSNFDKILIEELDKSNRAKRDIDDILYRELYRPSGVHFAYELPTRDRCTGVTASLSKARVGETGQSHGSAESVQVLRVPERLGTFAVAVNTDPVSLRGLLRISSDSIRQLLSSVNFDYAAYLSRIQFPQLPSVGQGRPKDIKDIGEYMCNICGAAFSKPSELSDHIAAHELGSVRDCCVCRHLLERRAGCSNVFTCKYCGQCFTRAYCCELHQQSCGKRLARDQDPNSRVFLT